MLYFIFFCFLFSPIFGQQITTDTTVREAITSGEFLDVFSPAHYDLVDVKSVEIDGNIYNNGSITARSPSSYSTKINLSGDYFTNYGTFSADLYDGKFDLSYYSFNNYGNIFLTDGDISIATSQFHNYGHVQFYDSHYPSISTTGGNTENEGSICYRNSIDGIYSYYSGTGCIVLDSSELYINEKFAYTPQTIHLTNNSHVLFDETPLGLSFSGFGDDSTIGSFSKLYSYTYDTYLGALQLYYYNSSILVYIGKGYDESKFEKVTYAGSYTADDYNSIKYNGPCPNAPYDLCYCADKQVYTDKNKDKDKSSNCDAETVTTTVFKNAPTKTVTVTKTETTCPTNGGDVVYKKKPCDCYTYTYTYTEDYVTFTETCTTDVATFIYYHSYICTVTYVDATTTIWYKTYTTDTYTCHHTSTDYETVTTWYDTETTSWDDTTTWSESETTSWTDTDTWSDSTTWDDSTTWSDSTTWDDSTTWSDSTTWDDSTTWSDSTTWDDSTTWSDSTTWDSTSTWVDIPSLETPTTSVLEETPTDSDESIGTPIIDDPPILSFDDNKPLETPVASADPPILSFDDNEPLETPVASADPPQLSFIN
ncbi:uncharacterized protein SPAPADRAFT_52731 [Spathaspora passalidarum NRRL Y-27907]|uniref:Hyphally-regulated cell wall protein N-terminal domain-containing protein n=1 Tax=Spathaspora passalidarum (strain NRRL Y-27907 / 11-Y1) TaxID=619300 RepID=G3AV73_SPAPN|nr:uncharacterized protein SPAPADRAFT_52731 [Spathaspora passalidarum NRRL Y-27907]EGW29876.1 hypothetical protein SPAPADRAFT_52731 [Spathaspora passalidarum NRRL Y-27907]